MTNLAVMESGVGGQTANATAQMFLTSSMISSIMYALLTQQIGMQNTVYSAFAEATKTAIEDSAKEIHYDAEKAMCSAFVTGVGAAAGGGFAAKEALGGTKTSKNLRTLNEQQQFLKDNPAEKNPEQGLQSSTQQSALKSKKDFDQLKELTEKENAWENWDSKVVQKGDSWKSYEGRKLKKFGRKSYTTLSEEQQTKLDDLDKIRQTPELKKSYKETLDKKANELEKRLSDRSTQAWGRLTALSMFVTTGNSLSEALTTAAKAKKEEDRADHEAKKTQVQSTTDLVNQSMSMSTKSADSANKIADNASTMVYEIMRNNAV